MIDIKLRNVKVEDADNAIYRIKHFMKYYYGRRGIRGGVVYNFVSSDAWCKFYVYRTEKTVICVGDYGVVDK